MKLKFLGGADQVGPMGMLLQHKGANLMFEYGMAAEKPPLVPMPAPPTDFAFLTHCHLDHCGMMPWLCGRYDNEVLATPMTIDVTELIMKDSLKIAKLEGYPAHYDQNDISTTMRNFVPMDFGETIDVAGFEVEMHSAGHVPGATMFELRGDRTTVYTGDLHTYNTRLVWGAHPVRCDNLIIEGTYGGKLHPDRLKSEYMLQEKVKEVVERGGTALIPSFAVGRTQEIMMVLKDLKYDMWVDGMGKSVTRMYLENPDYVRNVKKLKAAKRAFQEVRSSKMREHAKKGEVIVTTGGMMDGGPVLSYLQRVKDDKRSAILLTGYQADDTNGRLLLDEGYILDRGAPVDINCEVHKYDFSAHADHNELVSFVRACDPENVVIMHSESREALAQDLQDYNVLLPATGEEFELD